jgi:DNA-binding HxlR family transcriptional regulator
VSSSKPIDDALDLLGRRWALRLIWELRRTTLSFSELRTRTGISPSVLSARLAELVKAGVLERDTGRRYRLSGRGRELARLLYELNRWAVQAGVSSRSELA